VGSLNQRALRDNNGAAIPEAHSNKGTISEHRMDLRSFGAIAQLFSYCCARVFSVISTHTVLVIDWPPAFSKALMDSTMYAVFSKSSSSLGRWLSKYVAAGY